MVTAKPSNSRGLALSLMAMTTFAALAACASTGHAAPKNGRTRGAIGQAQQLSEAFTAVAERVSPAVVSIKVETKRRAHGFGFGFPFGDPGERGGSGQGSGFIFRSDGAILTNYHVVAKADEVEVVLRDGRTFVAEVVGSDPSTDVAVLKINAGGLPSVPFANSDQARVGEWVVAIGSPFGLDYSLTVGVVSAIGRGLGGADKIEDYLQTDASINPGNSGGPLVNLDGEVLGVNTMILGPRNAGIGFAIPANLARRVAEQLLETGAVKHAWIGVHFQELTPELAKSFGTKAKGGALIADVQTGSPADKAGLQAGDVVLSVDGSPVKEGRDLLRGVISKRVGQSVKLGILRRGKTLAKTLVTEARPGSEELARGRRRPSKGGGTLGKEVGLSLRAIDGELARRLGYQGKGKVVVSDVSASGAAARAGLRPGDVILEADHKQVKTPDDVVKALRDGAALLFVESRGGTRYVALKKPRKKK